MFERVSRQRISDEVFLQIQKAITKGELKPGTKLPSEREMSKEFGVSRVAIREALRKLEQLGLITIKLGMDGGAIVSELSHAPVAQLFGLMVELQEETLLELIEVRRIIEVPAAGLAALRRTAEDLERIGEAIDRMRLAAESGWRREFHDLNVFFHIAIVEAARNRVLTIIMKSIEDALQDAFELVPFTKEIVASTVNAHTEILKAIESQNRAVVEELMGIHVLDFEKYLSLKNQSLSGRA